MTPDDTAAKVNEKAWRPGRVELERCVRAGMQYDRYANHPQAFPPFPADYSSRRFLEHPPVAGWSMLRSSGVH